MKKALIYMTCVAALSSSNALAQSQGTGELQGCVAEPEDKVTNVYFGNGVGNSKKEADFSFAYLRARSGTLDVDDTSSFGPENYFVACNKIELGTYRIGVNYFRGTGPRAPGTGPSTATVALFLGDGTIPSPKRVVLPASRGNAGNGSPQILFTIQVTENVDPQTQKRSAVYTVQ